MRRRIKLMAGAALLAVAGGAAATLAQDNGGILPPGEGRETVRTICSGCHSIRLVAQQGMSRERWDKTIKSMVEEQGMPELDSETRATVLDYLAENLDAGGRQREGPSPFNRPAPLSQ